MKIKTFTYALGVGFIVAFITIFPSSAQSIYREPVFI